MELKISRIGAFTTTWHLIVASMENDFILEPTLNRYSQTCSLRATVLVPYYSFGVYQEQPKTGALRPESPKHRSETKAVRDHQITNTSDVSFWERLLPRLHCRLQFEVVKTVYTAVQQFPSCLLPVDMYINSSLSVSTLQVIPTQKWNVWGRYRHNIKCEAVRLRLQDVSAFMLSYCVWQFKPPERNPSQAVDISLPETLCETAVSNISPTAHVTHNVINRLHVSASVQACIPAACLLSETAHVYAASNRLHVRRVSEQQHLRGQTLSSSLQPDTTPMHRVKVNTRF